MWRWGLEPRSDFSCFYQVPLGRLRTGPCVPAVHHDHGHVYGRTIDVNGERRPYLDLMGWANLASVAYLPATVAPVGRTADGLPVGIQIIGPYLEDRTPMHIAKLMEDVTGGFVPPPGYEDGSDDG